MLVDEIVRTPAVALNDTLLPALISNVLAAEPLNVYKLVPSVVPELTLRTKLVLTLLAEVAAPPADDEPA